ncbi:MAG: cation:proton antiporter [Prevotella sp.]|uniref:cation:proton antiporter domain-containing protein n=1 Tax=Leyella stercorea TaxID=363265 RepID=UPI002800B605|nr:cation:proton antiporter [Leyella stercorea]MDY4198845.1 cation:proton antiporter [Prevotella sp.]
MSEVPTLINDLALILIVASTVTLLFKKLKQPLVLGYIMAGFIVSPHMPYTMSVMDTVDIKTWADIGVMFLLFSLGLDFSFKKIIKMGITPVITTLTIIFAMMTLGIVVGHAFDWKRMDCIFLGGMLAMSSTTIIYKAFTDMGLRQQKFAQPVMSVLILEDILAIVMMVMLSAIASGNNPDGGEMIGSVVKIGFFLVLWFVVGIFAVPWFLRSTRKLVNNETLLIVSLGLCCLMAVVSTKVGFSSAFGAFVMGSILAETIEAAKIEKLVAPVKDLFGAVFFVSVGMLVDPKIIVEYAIPIGVLVLTILIGQSIFGTFGFLIGGQSLKSAMRCGFSMAQIGEFSFIIASLGLSLHVTGEFLYPVVVAVSVITTFLTPYMIRLSVPSYNVLERHLPKTWVRALNNITLSHPSSAPKSNWHSLIAQMARITLIYSILSVATIALMFTFFLPFIRRMMPGMHWWANGICGVLTVMFIAPFLRAIVMKKNHSEEFRALWNDSRSNRMPLLVTILVRLIIASAFVFYICNYLTRFTNALMMTIAVAVVGIMILSRGLKKQSIKMERMFVQNLRSRDIEQQVLGLKKPLYEGHLLDRDIHISEIEIPENSTWAGLCLADLRLSNRFGIHVSSILRGHRRINIPGGGDIVFPGDKLQVIGSDSQLAAAHAAVAGDIEPDDPDIEKREMRLSQIVIDNHSPFVGKTLPETGLRSEFNCMVVGREEGKENLSMVGPAYKFRLGDILWIVGEEDALKRVQEANRGV